MTQAAREKWPKSVTFCAPGGRDKIRNVSKTRLPDGPDPLAVPMARPPCRSGDRRQTGERNRNGVMPVPRARWGFPEKEGR
jgi:hypothetical protein